ncbi:XdhC family protein [Cryptosporangium phraense]|uniref:XdhC Rossmann domain-containing protein n=1 Tax=Cryptosporangium phraense TaxID=2593070 RepID=A0A545AHP7_9ACTN|nr:XdhC/CoxI family protein [Cryptosporangium phraense]TQS40790.1 hypothetical protein FL583_33045 [Cryptosporangium phraense]
MREIGRTVAEWLGAGHRVAVARVVDVHGFGAVPGGEVLAFRDDGSREGSLLRGVADAVIASAVPDALSGSAAVVEAPVGESDAVAAGLACAGSARILVHAASDPSVWETLASGRPAALATSLTSGEPVAVSGPVADTASRLLAAGVSGRELVDDVLVDVWAPVPTVVTIGGGVLAAALAAQATLLGWSAKDVSSVPDGVAAVAEFGPADVLVLLDHDPAMDDVLRVGLAGPGFIGALGSRRTQAARRERLLASGVSAEDVTRIHGPVGLDIGARSPAETAVSVVAEVLATRTGRAGAALRSSDVAIH